MLAVVQAQLREVGLAHVGGGPRELCPRLLDHLRVGVDGDHAPAREAVEQQPRHAAGAAAGVEDRLVAAQLEAVEHRLGHRDLRAGDAVIGVRVPAAPGAHSAVVTGPERSRSRS